MMRERVAGGGSSMVAPKPLRNASSVRIVPSIQSEAISLIADIFTGLHRIRAGPSRPYGELVNAGLTRFGEARLDQGYRIAVFGLFNRLLADDGFADGDVKFAGEVVLGVAIGDGVAKFLAHRANLAANSLDIGRGREANRGP